MRKVLGSLWGLACIAVLAVTLVNYDDSGNSDVGVFLMWGMLLLCFPSSLLVAGSFTALIILQEASAIRTLDWIQSGSLGFLIAWLAFVGVGYWQWFRLVPRVWQRCRVSARDDA